MAIHVAHLAVIRDGTVRVETGGDIDTDLPFTLPDNTSDNSGVLTYMLNPSLPDNLTYALTLNGTQVLSVGVDSSTRHSEHEVVGGIRAGANTLRIQITGGTGGLAFSDIVLFYQRLV